MFFEGQILPLSNKNGTSFPWSIRHLHLSQNAPCLPPPPSPQKIHLHKHCFKFLLGRRYPFLVHLKPNIVAENYDLYQTVKERKVSCPEIQCCPSGVY